MQRLYVLNVEELYNPARQELILAGLALQRREKLSKLRREADRLRSLAAGALLKYGLFCWEREKEGASEVSGSVHIGENLQKVTWELLADCMGQTYREWDLRTKERGKPYIEGNPVYFNLSHSGSLVLCGISDQDIGVDIQLRTDFAFEKISDRYFTEQEKGQLEKCNSREEKAIWFYRFWTAKEAYAKLTGEGIGYGIGISPYYEAESLLIRCEELQITDAQKSEQYFGTVCTFIK